MRIITGVLTECQKCAGIKLQDACQYEDKNKEESIFLTLEIRIPSSSFGIQLSIHRMITSCCACVG